MVHGHDHFPVVGKSLGVHIYYLDPHTGEVKELTARGQVIKAEDVLKYKEKRDSERSDALREMQRLGQEFDAAT